MNWRRGMLRAALIAGLLWCAALAWKFDLSASVWAIVTSAPTASEVATSVDAAETWTLGCTGPRATECLDATPQVISRPPLYRDVAWQNLERLLAFGPGLLGFLAVGGIWIARGFKVGA